MIAAFKACLKIGLACALGIAGFALSAHAGTNTWSSVQIAGSQACEIDSRSASIAVQCHRDGFSPVPPAVTCYANVHLLDVTSPPLHMLVTVVTLDTISPFICDGIQQGGGDSAQYASWFFDEGPCPNGAVFHPDTGSCAAVDEQRDAPNGALCKGSSCDVLSGNQRQQELDYSPGSGVLAFARTYSSLNYHPTKDHASPLGKGWLGSYFQYLAVPAALSSTVVHAVRPTGDVIGFTATAPSSPHTEYVATGEFKERLVVALNTSGGFMGWRYITESDDVETYDSSGRLVSIKHRGGVTETLTYGPNDRVQTVADDFGRALQFEWDSSVPPRLASVVLPGGESGQIDFEYDSYNNLISVTYPDGRQRRYLYELAGYQRNLLTGIEDESGERYASWSYGIDNRVARSQHAGGVDSYNITYNSDGSRVVVDPLGAAVTYTTDVIGGQRRYTGASSPCATCGREFASVTYDAAGNFESTIDFNGVETRYTHDAARTLETSRTEAYSTAVERTIATEWHPTFRLPSKITKPGSVNTFTYDTAGNVLTRTETDTATSESRTSTFTYSSFGQLLTVDGPRSDVSDVTRFTYYTCTTGAQCGQLHTVTDAANNVTTYNSYDAHGQPLRITAPNGTVVTLAYDSRQRLTSRTIAGETTSFEYWPTGLLKKVTEPDGSSISYDYDAAHRLTRVTDTAGNSITYTLNAAGQRLIEEVRDTSNALTFRRSRVYDELGRLIEEHGTAGQVTSFAYDDEGYLIGIEDPVGRITKQTYDELSRLASVTDPAQQLLEFTYDSLDNLISVTDPRALTTSYTYNGFGEQVGQSSPDSGMSSSPRDAAGNVSSATDARNETGDYTYDALNRVATIEYGDDTVSFVYDAGTNGNGQLTSVANGASAITWTYDGVGRVIGRSQTTGSVMLDVGYGYDIYGRLESVTTPSGQLITYAYEDGRVSGVKVNGSYVVSDVTYQPFGPTTGWTWGNGAETTRTYDTDGQLTTVSSAGSSTFTFNEDGTIAARSDDFASNLAWTSGTTTFEVAPNSNRIESATGQISRSYGYDATGNTTSDGIRTFTYNGAGRMRTATRNGATTTYSYNGLGERVKKTSAIETVYFAYDEAGHLVGEYDESGELIQETVWFGDIPVAALVPDGGSGVSVFYIHTDHLNTPRRITRPSDDAIVWRWDSDPFGDTNAHEDPDGDTLMFAYNLRFPGQYFDAETELHYNYFRDYDAATGRYIQSDPIGLAGGLNTYGYALHNPLSYTDIFGLDVLLQSHPVALGQDHAKLTLIPENQDRWRGDPRFKNRLPDGRHYATLGAGPEGGYLVSNHNRERDVRLDHNESSTACPVPGRYGSEDALIEALFAIDQSYRDDADYEFFPSRYSDGYNSNSYISGLLRAAGINMPAPPSTPGYDKPLPIERPR